MRKFKEKFNDQDSQLNTDPSNPIEPAGGMTALKLASNASILSFTSYEQADMLSFYVCSWKFALPSKL